MSFEGLQIRLAALQETTAQLKELVDRLANLKFQPGSVALDTAEEGGVSGELSAEIGQLLRDGEDEKELLLEEVEFLRNDGHEKSRLQEGVERQGRELERYGLPFLSFKELYWLGSGRLTIVSDAVPHFDERGWRQRGTSLKHNA